MLGRWRMLLFALMAETMVANRYYVQSLLADIAASSKVIDQSPKPTSYRGRR